MELVNRETNFNKVFTNAPSSNVGVINPLSYNTKFVSFIFKKKNFFCEFIFFRFLELLMDQFNLV
jgi:hypothetical protein